MKNTREYKILSWKDIGTIEYIDIWAFTTDGYENSSRKYDSEIINTVIQRLNEKDGVFTYIGANQDAILEAGKIGIFNVVDFDADESGTREMWAKERDSRLYFMQRTLGGVAKLRLKSDYFTNE